MASEKKKKLKGGASQRYQTLNRVNYLINSHCLLFSFYSHSIHYIVLDYSSYTKKPLNYYTLFKQALILFL